VITAKVEGILWRHRELEEKMASPEVASDPSLLEKIGREYNGIARNLPAFKRYLELANDIASARQIIADGSDADLAALAAEELADLEREFPECEERVKMLLVPRDPKDVKNAVLEIRAGTGGTEAGIFAADLYRMFTHFFEKKGWETEVLSSSYGDMNAIKEIIINVRGENAYGALKYESGVHRVQRVPLTEAQGRVHTSAASVAVFPEADEFEVQINPNDLRIDLYCSSGPGGQSVNTTYSAVRIMHVPTGLIVTCQDEKSQHKNKARAMKVLASRILQAEQERRNSETAADRKAQVGSGDRSERIRTYNFPQGRCTDHRGNLTLYSLDKIMTGEIQPLVDALAAHARTAALRV